MKKGIVKIAEAKKMDEPMEDKRERDGSGPPVEEQDMAELSPRNLWDEGVETDDADGGNGTAAGTNDGYEKYRDRAFVTNEYGDEEALSEDYANEGVLSGDHAASGEGGAVNGNGIRENIEIKDGHEEVEGILEIVEGGFGFLGFDNFLTSEDDVYVSTSQIRRFALRTGDKVKGLKRPANPGDRFGALIFLVSVNGKAPYDMYKRKWFKDLTPIHPNERIKLETTPDELATRTIDLVAPIGKGQRGLIVAPPKAGKTVLLKKIAMAVEQNHPEIELIVLLVDERPEEVTEMKRCLANGSVIYSTFDEQPSHHVKVAQMVMERARRLAEDGRDVMILLDSITRLARAYNLTVTPSGRTMSGGFDPAALHPPKQFFGTARNIEEGGSVTILATALIDTGSRMDELIFEEFKGTGNMDIQLDRKLSEHRIFPAISLFRSGTRNERLLLSEQEYDAIRKLLSMMYAREISEAKATEMVLDKLASTKSNAEFISQLSELLSKYKQK